MKLIKCLLSSVTVNAQAAIATLLFFTMSMIASGMKFVTMSAVPSAPFDKLLLSCTSWRTLTKSTV